MKRFMHHHRGCGPEHGPEQNEGEGPQMGRGHRWRHFFEAGAGGFGRPFSGPFSEEARRRFHGRGERRRMFEGGELKLVFLALMEAEPRHGYDLIREIETRTGGAYAPSPGIVYPTLTLLEEMGHIEAQASEGAKKQFALTEAGKAFLEQNRREAEAALARLDALGDRAMPMEAGPVARAMQNLKTALSQRLSNQPDKKVLFEVADLIDEAARKIERL
jgi:DNA-binding PadR family transcriptional regulator